MINTIMLTDWNAIKAHILKYMMQDDPIFFSRIGGSDTEAAIYYKEFPNFMYISSLYPFMMNRVKNYNGYFDFSDDKEIFKQYLELMIYFYKESETCSFTQLKSFISAKHTKLLDYVLEGKTIIDYKFIEYGIPQFLSAFSIWAKDKKILIISPLSKSIEYQWQRKDQLYVDYHFPEMELKTYNTTISYNNANDTKESLGFLTNNWEEEAFRMASEISKIDFDIALLSCASYGMYLGSYIRDILEKKALYMGGVLNVYFNIYGGRYSQKARPNFYKNMGLNPAYNIDPLENSDINHIKGGRGIWCESLNAYFGKK